MIETKGYKFSIFNPLRKVHYYAICPLDEGGFGKVWLGVTENNLPAAIKIIKPSSNFSKV